jgi:BASS family bile acid:Na+ symporter
MPGGSGLRTAFDLGFVEMGTIIFQLILLPLLFGMWLNVRFPVFITKVRPWVQRLSLLIFFAILVLALWGNRSNIIQFLGYVFILVAVHNGMGLGSGYLLGRIFRLPEADSRALAFETGVHNTALGLLLIFKFFNGLGGMALVAAWWGIWDLVSGYSLAWYWRRSAKVSGGIR